MVCEMALPLTSEMLATAYEYLRSTPPFVAWNLPDADDVRFKVARTPKLRGWYVIEGDRHLIAISTGCVGYSLTLLMTMAHEMIHLFLNESGMDRTGGEHSAAFHKLGRQVCAVHGFDPKLF